MADLPAPENLRFSELPISQEQAIDRLCVEFVQAFEAGAHPRLEEYLDRVPQPAQKFALAELLTIEIGLLRATDPSLDVEAYRQRFPAFGNIVDDIIQFVLRKLDSQQSFQSASNAFKTARDRSTMPGAEFLSSETREHYPDLPSPVKCELDQLLEALVRLKRFEIQRPLGIGGMGAVFEAYDRLREGRVALKTIRNPNPEAIYRFKREFLRLANVVHPNIAPLYELVSEAECWFLTMKLIAGVSILRFVRDDPLPTTTESDRTQTVEQITWNKTSDLTSAQENRIRLVLPQLIAGVQALHEAGILHRDLKPSNVLATSEGHVVILDFGLTTGFGSGSVFETRDHAPAGTAYYMSPEQMDGLDLTPASDWYAVGVMLFEMLTGVHPFSGDWHQLRRFKAKRLLVKDLTSAELPKDLAGLCLQLLNPRPESRPAGEEIIRNLNVNTAEHPETTPSRAAQREDRPFIGREALLQSLQDAFTRSRHQKGTAVHVVGQSGVGKSALVEQFLEQYRREGAVILAGRCYERVSVAYPGLDGLVDSVSRYLQSVDPIRADAVLPRDVAALAQVFPVLGRVPAVAESLAVASDSRDQQELKRRAIRALRELFARIGDRMRLLLFIDDFQWSDADSANVLADLLLPPDPPALLLIVSYRAEDASSSPAIAALRRGPHELVHVDELSTNDSAALAKSLLDRSGIDEVSAGLAQQIAQESAGNPFFIVELTHKFRTQADTSARAAQEGLSIDSLVWSRVQQLATPARALLEALAVAGRPLDVEIAKRCAQLQCDSQEILNLLQSQHFIRSVRVEGYAAIETYHDRIRESIHAHLTDSATKEYHERIARALVDGGIYDPAVVAEHFHYAGFLDVAAGYYEQAAAQAAEAVAFDRAAELYRLALELRDPPADQGLAIRCNLADALANAGRGAEAASEYMTIAALSNSKDRNELLLQATMQYLISGHMDEGLDTLSTVTSALGMRMPQSARATIMSLVCGKLFGWLRVLRVRPVEAKPEDRQRADVCWSGFMGFVSVFPLRAAWFQLHHVHYARRSGDRRRLARALAAETILRTLGGGRAQLRNPMLLAQVKKLGEQAEDPYIFGIAALSEGMAKYTAGKVVEAVTLCDQARDIFQKSRAKGVSWESDTAILYAMWSRLFIGQIAEISHTLPQIYRECRDRGNYYLESTLILVRSITLLAADEPESARQAVREVVGRWTRREFHIQHLLALMAETFIDLYVGEPEIAWRRLTAEWSKVQGAQILRVELIRGYLEYLRCCAALASSKHHPQSKELLKHASTELTRLECEKVEWCLPFASLLRGCLAKHQGDLASAAKFFHSAALKFREFELALYLAVAQYREGECRGGESGRAMVEEAQAWMRAEGIQNPARMTTMLAP